MIIFYIILQWVARRHLLSKCITVDWNISKVSLAEFVSISTWNLWCFSHAVQGQMWEEMYHVSDRFSSCTVATWGNTRHEFSYLNHICEIRGILIGRLGNWSDCAKSFRNQPCINACSKSKGKVKKVKRFDFLRKRGLDFGLCEWKLWKTNHCLTVYPIWQLHHTLSWHVSTAIHRVKTSNPRNTHSPKHLKSSTCFFSPFTSKERPQKLL